MTWVKRYLKTTPRGARFVVELYKDGSAREWEEGRPEEAWSGHWSEPPSHHADHVLRLIIGGTRTEFLQPLTSEAAIGVLEGYEQPSGVLVKIQYMPTS